MSQRGTVHATSLPDGEVQDDELPFDEAPEDEGDPEAERQASMEAEARRMGWRPQDEYRGPPGQWRSAEEFLKRGESILPIVRKDLQRERERANNMENEIKALRQTVDEQKAVMDDLLKMARTASETGYKRALDELKNQKREAAKEGDIARVVAIDEQISEVEEERAARPLPKNPEPKPKVDAPQPKQPELAPEVVQFVRDNPWFNTDPVLHKAMEAEHMALLQDAPALPLEENLERAKEAVMARYPRKFGINPKPKADEDDNPPPPARRTSVSAPTQPAAGRRQTATGIASLTDPQERAMAQQAFNRAKRLMPDLTEAEWFSVYENPKADVIDVITTSKQKRKQPNA